MKTGFARLFGLVIVMFGTSFRALSADSAPEVLVTGLSEPTALAVSADGKVYVALGGQGKGSIGRLVGDKVTPWATGLKGPTRLVALREMLFALDGDRIVRIDGKGKATPYVEAKAFPTAPKTLIDLALDVESGTLFTSSEGALYRILPKGGKVEMLLDTKRHPSLKRPTGLVSEGASHLLFVDGGTLYRLKLSDSRVETVATDVGHGDATAWDWYGRLYLADTAKGQLMGIPRPGGKAVVVATNLGHPSAVRLDASGKRLLLADAKAGTIRTLPTTVPGAEVDETPLAFEYVTAFPKLEWEGWDSSVVRGGTTALRPIVLTHAGDGSNRVFVATQHGVIHVFPNDPAAKSAKIFLDIQDRVRYLDNQNEEGLLGLAFPPNYKQSREFYVFYTIRKAAQPHTNILARYRTRMDDPDRADPKSEEILLRIEHPFWNHDGGTVAFGPDGYLYVALGDGGAANDPFNNGQKLSTILGKILRIDVKNKEGDKPYAIPKDNPFVKTKDAKPEIYAYGLRNVWRFSFDRKTGTGWVADVGQNLYEEINLLVSGGNYGWNIRESLHPFGAPGVGPRADLVDPIWEYHHDHGKSITGGHVYRGKEFPELEGHYLYADYIAGWVKALRYDEGQKRVTANRLIPGKSVPVLSFGEDEQGEVYFMTSTQTGQGIFRLAKKK